MRLAPSLISVALIGAVCASCTVVAGKRAHQAEADYPPSGQLLNIDGTMVHAHVEGVGPDVILLHGASGNTRDFTFSLVGDLARNHRVIAFDRPGLGWTDRLPGKSGALNTTVETPAEQALLLNQAARKLGVEKAVIVGHSFGGAVALAWALHAPETAAAIVSFAGASHPWEGSLGAMTTVTSSRVGGATVVPALSAFVPRSYVEQRVAGIFAPQTPPDGYIDHVGAGLTLRPESLRANAQQMNTLLPHITKMSARYPDLDLPIEIIHGDADTIVPLNIHSIPLSQRAPGARLTVLEGIGHMPHHADPQAARDAIARAVDRAGLR